jgi:hypothetical protein
MRKIWTLEEDRKLAEIFPRMHNRIIAEEMGRSYGSVVSRAGTLGLKKDPGYIHELLMLEAQKLKKSGYKSRFQKGQPGMNKGKKLSEKVKSKISKTYFPVGHQPWNTKPVGYERVNKSGYIMIKLRCGKSVFKHQWLWENEFGKVPHGMVLKFIDGNPLNCVLGNLKLMSRAQTMLDNAIHNLPQDLKEVIRLKTRINRICDAKKQD